MPKKLIYKLKIDGPYTPDNIPMSRLSEYMSDLAALLGERNDVHFSKLEEGSAILEAVVDPVAVPKVSDRIASIEKGEAPKDLRKAYEELDKRLASDNAIGDLSVYEGQSSGAIVLNFPGRTRPKPLDYGTVRQQGSIDGIPVVVGGRDKTSHVTLEDREHTYTGIDISRELAKKIASCLYSKVIRLHGSGRWKRDEDGEWQLVKFRAESFEVLDDSPLREVLDQLRAIPGSEWSELDDPTSALNELRGESDDRPH